MTNFHHTSYRAAPCRSSTSYGPLLPTWAATFRHATIPILELELVHI